MAVELGRFIAEQLEMLPEGHPDRAFLQGVSKTVDGFNTKTYGVVLDESSSDEEWMRGLNERYRVDTARMLAEDEKKSLKDDEERNKRWNLAGDRLNQILDARGISIGHAYKYKILRMVSGGIVENIEDFSHISDDSLKFKLDRGGHQFYRVGKATLLTIREIFPYQPPNGSTS